MRSRTMLRRLDRIAPMAEEPLPDLSVLLPSEYDRFMDLAKANSLSDAELQEAEALLGKCPIKTEGYKILVPKVPRMLEDYWWSQGRPNRSHQVERKSFIGLCARYLGRGHQPVEKQNGSARRMAPR